MWLFHQLEELHAKQITIVIGITRSAVNFRKSGKGEQERDENEAGLFL